MIIYFYLLIALKILTVESSSIRDRTLKNDLVSLLSPRSELGRKDSNSLKIISQEPFIIQLGVSNGSENLNAKDETRERKRKRPAKKRISKLKSLRKKHRIRRDVKASDYQRISNDDMRKSNQTEKVMTDEAAKNLLVDITSKQLSQENSIKRQEMFQALTQAINETQQELERRGSTDEDLDKQVYEWLKAHVDKKQSSHQHQSSPMVGMVHQLPRKTDKNQPKYSYKDLMTDRDRLEQKIKYLKNYLSSNDSKTADDGTRVRRKSESDKVNKMAKMFLTLSAVNGMNDRKKFKCKEEEDDYDGDFWPEERKSSPSRRTTSTNEERYKVKKWIEHLKSKRSSRSSCPCQNAERDDETDIFPLELKLSKGLSSKDLGETSEESSETYRGYPRFFDYPHGKSSRTSFYKPRNPFNNDDLDNKLSSAFSKRGRRKFDLPLDDLETYRTRAKLILQNAEEILDRIKEEEEKRRATPGCLANQLKEITSRIQGDPRNSENDLIRVLQKTMGWNPLTNPDQGTIEGGKDSEGDSFPHKWSILDPYEKAKALTEENTRQLSSYLLRNLGKLGQITDQLQQPEQVEESKPSQPETNEKTQIYQGQVPQDKDSVLSSDDLRKENVPDSDPNQPGQGIGDIPTTTPQNKPDVLRVKNLQEPIKDKIKEILEEQEKQIQELAGKKSAGEENPDDLQHSIVTLEDYLDRIEENRAANTVPWKQSVGSPEENDEKPTNSEQVEATRGDQDENPTNSNQDDKVEAVEGKANTENDDKPIDPGQEEEEPSKLLKAPKKNVMNADSEDPKSGETTQDQVLQERKALEEDDKRPDLEDDDQVEAIKGKQNDDGDDETLLDVDQNDKVEATLGEDNIDKGGKTTELTEDDKVEAVEDKSNEDEGENTKDINQEDKVEAINSKEKTADDEVEAVQSKSNEETDEDPKDLNQKDKVEATSSLENRENTEDDEVEAVQGKSNEEDEDPEDKGGKTTELTEDDKVEAVQGKSNEEDEDPEDKGGKTTELTEDDKVEAVEGKSNEDEGENTKDINQDDRVEAINSKEKTTDEEVEAVRGKSNEEADEDPKDLNQDDKIEAINSKENSDDEVAAIQGKDNDEGEEDPTDLNQEDKIEALEGRENTDDDNEKLTNTNQKLRASNPLNKLKKNLENVNSDDKTEYNKSGESTQDPVVKQENDKERSSEDEDPNEEVDFTNKETSKASSVEDDETQQKAEESDVIGSQHSSKSDEQEDPTEPDVAEMSNPEDIETSKLTNEDLTVAETEPSIFTESSESQIKPKQNEDENDETNQDSVAAENFKFNTKSGEDDPKDDEQTPEKDFAGAEHPATSQENKSEEPNNSQTGKGANSDDRDENDLIDSKHLKKANEQDGDETNEALKDNDNTDDPSAKEHVSKMEEMIQHDSSESGSSSKETEDDDVEKVEKLDSTENDKSKSLESQGVEGVGTVPDEKDSQTLGVSEADDQILEAEKTDGEDSLRAEGWARVIENILGKEESVVNENGEDSKDGIIQSAPTTDRNPTEEDVVKEQPIQTDDSSTSEEVKPLLTYSKQNKQESEAEPDSADVSDELIESPQHNTESTKDWSIETGSPHHQTSEPSEENISEEPHLAKSNTDEDGSPKTESPHQLTSKSREPEEPFYGKLIHLVGEHNSGSEETEDLDYENINDDTLRAANPDQDELKHEDNIKAVHSDPKTEKKYKLSVPRSVGDIIKDLNDEKIKYGDDMSSLDPEKIDYFIDKIDKAEKANNGSHEVDCRKECACADEIDTRSRKIGRFEIVKDILHWMKDLQMNRVLNDN